MCMRLHITLPDSLIKELDGIAGNRERSAFIRLAVEEAIDQERRWRSFKDAYGALVDVEHEWDSDPAGWVHDQRRSEKEKRIG